MRLNKKCKLENDLFSLPSFEKVGEVKKIVCPTRTFLEVCQGAGEGKRKLEEKY